MVTSRDLSKWYRASSERPSLEGTETLASSPLITSTLPSAGRSRHCTFKLTSDASIVLVSAKCDGRERASEHPKQSNHQNRDSASDRGGQPEG